MPLALGRRKQVADVLMIGEAGREARGRGCATEATPFRGEATPFRGESSPRRAREKGQGPAVAGVGHGAGILSWPAEAQISHGKF